MFDNTSISCLDAFLVANGFKTWVVEQAHRSLQGNAPGDLWRQVTRWQKVLIYPSTEYLSSHVWLPIGEGIIAEQLSSSVIHL